MANRLNVSGEVLSESTLTHPRKFGQSAPNQDWLETQSIDGSALRNSPSGCGTSDQKRLIASATEGTRRQGGRARWMIALLV